MSDDPVASPTQLDLFSEYQLGPTHLSRTIPLWDLMPLYLFSRTTELPSDTPISNVPPLTNKFEHRGETFHVNVMPAMWRDDKKNATRVVYPGEREQLISAAIRALAVRQQAPVGIKQIAKEGPLVTVAFTIRQLQKELQATSHTFSHNEIVDSLKILVNARVTIRRSRDGQEPIDEHMSLYYSFASQEDKCIATLNRLESQQIIAGAYRAVNYKRMMELDDPIARWIYQYVHAEHRGARKPVDGNPPLGFRITLEMLFERGLLSRSREVRKLIPRVRTSLDLLASTGFLYVTDKSPGYDEELQTKATKGRSLITGATWRLYISARDVDDIIDENAEAQHRAEIYRHWPTAQRLKAAQPVRERLAKKR